jgi:hypothetical protein
VGVGLRLTHSINRNWALQTQIGLLGNRDGEETSSNSLGSQNYQFRSGYQVRIGALHRNKVSFVIMWRVLDYDVELRPLEQPWTPVRSSGSAHLLALGVMLHGKTGTIASLGSIVCMGFLTAVGNLAATS